MGVIMRMLMNGGVHDGRRILQAGDAGRHVRAPVDLRSANGGNGDTPTACSMAWGLGNEQFPDDPPGTRLVEGGGFPRGRPPGRRLRPDVGVRWSTCASGNGMVVLVGGTSTDPLTRNKGRYSSLARFQERILTAL